MKSAYIQSKNQYCMKGMYINKRFFYLIKHQAIKIYCRLSEFRTILNLLN